MAPIAPSDVQEKIEYVLLIIRQVERLSKEIAQNTAERIRIGPVADERIF